ncbi:cullin binding protein-like protein CanA [Calycina marina]|uniref:Cullin binding protein-like protein CanA n=1 Tax=Calycina marina TaxID=1763456 RepID=A0A9P7ZBT7_9HELO|nr:cullin binding protein-like protein CanA [Calycina marina]
MSSTPIPSNPTSQNVAQLLPKLHDADPDARYMCLNDMLNVLTNGRPDFLHSDFSTSARAVDGILKSLDDSNGEVQNLAIKCLSPLVSKLASNVLGPLIEKLTTLNLTHSVDNSIPAMALQKVVATFPRPVTGIPPSKEVVEAYSAISRVLIPRLVGRIVVGKPPKGTKLPPAPTGMLDLSTDVGPEAVEVLIEVVRCFGPMLEPEEVEALQSLLVQILDSERISSSVKKRSVAAVSILGLYLTDLELGSFVSQLIQNLRNPHLTAVQRRLYITILGSLARSIPSRFGPYLKTLAPFVFSALSQRELDEQLENSAEDGEPDSEAADVREAALVALEGFLASCGGEMRSYTEETISSALRYLKYDPNYNDDDDDEMSGTQPDEDDIDDFGDEFEAGDTFDDDDDDDASWKVRRCAAKTLYTLISTRGSGDLLDDGTIYTQIAPILVQRINEREENVRLEIIATIVSLVRKTGEGVLVHDTVDETGDYSGTVPASLKRRRASSAGTYDTNTLLSSSAGLSSPTAEPLPASGPRADLARLTPSIIRVITKALKTSTVPTKQAVVKLLDNIVSVQQGGLEEYFGQIIDPIIESSKTSSGGPLSNAVTAGGAASATVNSLRIASLRLIGDICKTHKSAVLQPYLQKIIPGVLLAAKDKFNKVPSEAIGTIEQLIRVLTPPRSRSSEGLHQPDLQKLYNVIIDRVSSTEADVEVRQRAIHALGTLLARTASPAGTSLISVNERTSALNLLNDRLKNETTRISTVRAIDNIAIETTAKGQLQPKWIREVSLELSAQFRKANRALRGASLDALKHLVVSPAARGSLDQSTIEGLVSALLPLLTTKDLHLLRAAFIVLASLVKDSPKLVVTDSLTSALCALLKGDALHGAALDALLLLVQGVGEVGAGQNIMTALLKDVGIDGDPAVVGKVMGTLVVFGQPSVGVTFQNFVDELNNPASQESQQSLALAVLGETGLRQAGQSPLKPVIFLTQFMSKFERVRLASAVALGRAGAGNVPVYLPEILATMDKGGNAQYLLLHSIKEVLQQASKNSADITNYTKPIWDRLLVAAQIEDNKAIGAECIGRLVVIDPKTYIPELQKYLVDKSPSVRAMAIQAIRYTLSDVDETFDLVLKSTLVDMIVVMLQDKDLENRRLALTTLNSASHNKPDLIVPALPQLLPFIMKESVIRPALVREVMMGPFKHKVDDGLEVRKSAYETLYSLMETAFQRINVLELYDRVIEGLKDEHDIRSLCYLMVHKLSVLDVEETSRRLDAIAECLRMILSTKLKDTAVKQEIEKQDEAVKGAFRISQQLDAAIPSANRGPPNQSGQHQTWRSYWEWIEKDFREVLNNAHSEILKG